MALPEAFKKNAEKKKEEGEVREGESDKKEKQPPFAKKSKGKKVKETKDTEIIEGGKGSEGVTKMNDPRKKGMPSLDDENTDACMKKDKKGGKDCGCKHKNDALTPQEYIAACDGGFQDRSRTYIRARLDAGKGTGKKCGNSHIARTATCNVNGGGGSQPRLKDLQGYGSKKESARNNFAKSKGSTKGIGNKLKVGAEVAAQLGSAASIFRAGNKFSQGKIGAGAQSFLSASALSSVAAGSKASRMGNKGLASDFNRQACQLAAAKVGVSALQTAGRVSPRQAKNAFSVSRAKASNAAFSVEQHMKGFKKMKKKRDSVWADGFSKTDAETALTANSMNLATDKYSKEKRKKNAQGQPRNMIYSNTFNT